MRRSWKDNPGQSLCYDEALLASQLGGPRVRRELASALYEGTQLVGCVGVFPQKVQWQERVIDAPLLSLFTIAPELKGQGQGKLVWRDCLQRLERADVEAAFHFCVKGNISNEVIAAAVASLGFRLIELPTVGYAMRFLSGPAPEAARQVSDPVGIFLDLVQGITSPIRRVWSGAEASWHVLERPGALYSVYEEAGKQGMTVGLLARIDDSTGTECVLVEEILDERLSEQGKVEMLRRFFAQATRLGAKIAMAPILGHTDPELLRKAGLRKSPRKLRAYLTLWNDAARRWNFPEATPPSFYVDVF